MAAGDSLAVAASNIMSSMPEKEPVVASSPKLDPYLNYRRVTISRNHLLDYIYKKRHSRLFRFRKRLQRGLRRWKRRNDRGLKLLPIPNFRDLFDPNANICSGGRSPSLSLCCFSLTPS